MSRSILRFLVLLSSAWVLLAAGPLRGQEAPPPTDSLVPLELVEALSLLGDGVASTVLVGELPEWLRTLITVPPDARTVGSMVRPDLVIGVLATSAEPRDARERWDAILTGAGFEPWREERPPRGFVSAASEPGIYCAGDSLSIHVAVGPRTGGGSHVRLMASDDDRYGACRFREGSRPLSSPIPALLPPEGARSRGGESGGGPGAWRSSALVETALTLVDLIEHYESQLREHGWSPVTALMGDETALLSHSFVDDDGDEWTGIFTAVRVDEEQFALEVRLVDSDEPGGW